MPARTDLAGVTAAILAGGLGTRLRSVVADRPKVLAPVAGKPYLHHLLAQLDRAGVGETVLLTGHGADQVREACGDSFGAMRLAYSTEAQPLGTGGALRLALPHLTQPTALLLNGDSYCDVDLNALRAFHHERGATATLTLTHVENASRFGRVVTGDRNCVERFEEKNSVPEPGWINAGMYLLERELIEAVPPDRALSLERDLMPAWVSTGRVFGFPGNGRFIDIGVPESFAEAQHFFAESSRG